MRLLENTALAALSYATLLAGAPGARAGSFRYLNDFAGVAIGDGYEPYPTLINVNGTLYGTTYAGGSGPPCTSSTGCGTVFALDPTTGAEHPVYAFKGGSDGSYPIGRLVKVGNTLYGTTSAGGGSNLCVSGCGTVFSIDLSTGAEHVVYAFVGGSDGTNPYSGLIKVGDKLFGTTPYGGEDGLGTVYSIDLATGAEKVVYYFGGESDGRYPYATLIDVGGTLYGTTTEGGGDANAGIVFALNPRSGREKIVYTFGGGPDGVFPTASLIASGGLLYGTTNSGGAHGNGSVFSVDPVSGAEKVLDSFTAGNPFAELTLFHGRLWGTTVFGGGSGYGSIFSVDMKTGKLTIAYSFVGSTQGQWPSAGLLAFKGGLYGTTGYGGSADCYDGCGTAFVYSPHN